MRAAAIALIATLFGPPLSAQWLSEPARGSSSTKPLLDAAANLSAAVIPDGSRAIMSRRG